MAKNNSVNVTSPKRALKTDEVEIEMEEVESNPDNQDDENSKMIPNSENGTQSANKIIQSEDTIWMKR